MKKRICTALILLLVFSLCFGGSALAEGTEPGLDHITDAAGILSAEQLSKLESLAAQYSEQGQVELYIVTMEDYSEYPGDDVVDCAGQLYEYFSLGSGADRSGVLLLLSMKELDYALIVRGSYGSYCFGEDNMGLAETAFLNGCGGGNWAGGMEDYLNQCGDILLTARANNLSLDQTNLTLPGQTYPYMMYRYGVTDGAGQSEPQPTETPAEPVQADPTTASQPPRADGRVNHVTDEADILTADQELRLENKANEISQNLNFDVYIYTVWNYRDRTSGDVNACAMDIYTYYDMGSGAGRDGLLLLLSMQDRDYSIIHYGYYGEYCFGDHNLDLIESAFLDDFRRNDWEGGFSDYLSVSEDVLRTAAAHNLSLEKEDQSFRGQAYTGNTYRYGVTGKLPVPLRLLIALGGPSIAALIVCSTFKAQMKTAKERTTAEDYVVPGSATLRIREDRFTHRTETRTKIQTESHSSGGGGRSSFGGGGGGGFGGHSGKF